MDWTTVERELELVCIPSTRPHGNVENDDEANQVMRQIENQSLTAVIGKWQLAEPLSVSPLDGGAS